MLPGPLSLLYHRTDISLFKLSLPKGLLRDRFWGPAPRDSDSVRNRTRNVHFNLHDSV